MSEKKIILQKNSLENIVHFVQDVIKEDYGKLREKDICKYVKVFDDYFHRIYEKYPAHFECEKNIYHIWWV